jgi:hypothetical protein
VRELVEVTHLKQQFIHFKQFKMNIPWRNELTGGRSSVLFTTFFVDSLKLSKPNGSSGGLPPTELVFFVWIGIKV